MVNIATRKDAVDFMAGLRKHIEDNSNELGFNVLYGALSNGYFTVEDKEGYRAYVSIHCFTHMGVNVSICYKPTKKKGAGKMFRESTPYNYDKIIDVTKQALENAIGYEKDTRQPASKESMYI